VHTKSFPLFFFLLLLTACTSSVNHWKQAQLEWAQKDYLGAIIELNTCLRNKQESDSIYLLRARCYQQIQNDSFAANDYHKALQLNPRLGEAKLELGRLQLRANDTTSACKAFRELLHSQPARITSDAWIELGRNAYFSDQFPRAIVSMNKAVQSDSSNHMAWYYRGLLYSRFFTPEGETRPAYYPFLDMPRAIHDFSESIRLQSDFADAWYQRAMVHFNQFDQAQGMRDINEAIRLEPHYSYYYSARAHQLLVAGKDQAALNDYNQAISLNAQDPEAYLGRAEVFIKLGKKEPALADRVKASQLDKRLMIGQ
jgi:tetratricopeptide (TPR) repeat protein